LVADDQDLLLDSLRAQQTLRRLVSNAGRTYSNAFCTTPICCPSRSSILTGRYVHNTGVINNTVPYCNSYLNGHENRTVATALHAAGYRTFYAGKYQNQYSNYTHVPPGWTDWFGLLGNSRYYNYSVSDNGVRYNYSDAPDDYFTDVVRHRSTQWLEDAISLDGMRV
jgi:arylsulfatase A-like enzyme